MNEMAKRQGLAVVTMPTDNLTRFPEQQVRVSIDPNLVAEYAEAMIEGAKFPPIVVFVDQHGTHYLADGHHRADAAVLAALKDRSRKPEILAEMHAGSLQDALRYAMRANVEHGKRLTQPDYKRSIELAFEHKLIEPERADEVVPALVALTGCSIRTAQLNSTKQRGEMIAKRDRLIMARHREGATQQQIAEELDVVQKTVSNVIERFSKKRGEKQVTKPPKRDAAPVADLPGEADALVSEEPKASEQPSSYRLDLSPYLPLLDSLRPVPEESEDSGVVGMLDDVEETVDVPKQAAEAFELIDQTITNMLGTLSRPKGLKQRYPAAAAAEALDRISAGISFLTELEQYIVQGVES